MSLDPACESPWLNPNHIQRIQQNGASAILPVHYKNSTQQGKSRSKSCNLELAQDFGDLFLGPRGKDCIQAVSNTYREEMSHSWADIAATPESSSNSV